MIGIIGGSGLYAMRELGTPRAHTVTTPFGAPSSPLMTGMLHGREVAFLARHGLQHQLLPGEINFRANIWALKSLGVRTVIGVSAVGSLREEIRPGDLALPSQYLDFTRGTRAASFFGGGLVADTSAGRPPCRATAALIARVARAGGVALHEDRTYACVEGPRLGTRAESLFLRAAGAGVGGADTGAVERQSRPLAAPSRRDRGRAPGGRVTPLPPGAAWRAAHAARAA